MTPLEIYFLKEGLNKGDYVHSNYFPSYVTTENIFKAGYEAKNEQIQKRIEEITIEIKNLTDSSMSTLFKVSDLLAVKKELEQLL